MKKIPHLHKILIVILALLTVYTGYSAYVIKTKEISLRKEILSKDNFINSEIIAIQNNMIWLNKLCDKDSITTERLINDINKNNERQALWKEQETLNNYNKTQLDILILQYSVLYSGVIILLIVLILQLLPFKL
jgi:hypothetical protein